MALVTASEVKEIMDNCVVSDLIVEKFITAGDLVITHVYAADESVGTDLLKEIERFFVAHLLASTPLARIPLEEKLGDAQVKYANVFGKNLDSTPYGQIVKTLDISGKLAAMGKQVVRIDAIEEFD